MMIFWGIFLFCCCCVLLDNHSGIRFLVHGNTKIPLIHVCILSSYEDMRKIDFLLFSGGDPGCGLLTQIARCHPAVYGYMYVLNINK